MRGPALAIVAILTFACSSPAVAPTAPATSAPTVAATGPAGTPSPGAASAPATAQAARPAFLTTQLTDVRTGERFTLGGFQGKVVLGIAMAVW